MSTNGGGWKNHLIGILITALVCIGGSLWMIGMGENSYFQDRKTLIDTLARLTVLVDQNGNEIGAARERIVATEINLLEIQRRLDRMENR